jgi:hypothetical protein
VANVLTSAPFFLMGTKQLALGAPGATAASRAYGVSLLGVGAAAVAYHASAGETRPNFRQVDYLTIGAASWVRARGVERRAARAALQMCSARARFPANCV